MKRDLRFQVWYDGFFLLHVEETVPVEPYLGNVGFAFVSFLVGDAMATMRTN